MLLNLLSFLVSWFCKAWWNYFIPALNFPPDFNGGVLFSSREDIFRVLVFNSTGGRDAHSLLRPISVSSFLSLLPICCGHRLKAIVYLGWKVTKGNVGFRPLIALVLEGLCKFVGLKRWIFKGFIILSVRKSSQNESPNARISA